MKIIGYVDLNNKELKDLDSLDLYTKKGILFKTSSHSKRFIKQFCDKLNKAKVYAVILVEVKHANKD
jgi:hypothetical protein